MGLGKEFQIALRVLQRQPLFTSVVVVILALGIGANTAIFSVVNSVLLRPLNYRDARQLYVIHEVIPQWTKAYPVLDANLPDSQIWQQQAHSFDGIAIAESESMILTGSDEPEELRGTRASASFLDLLGVRPELGRLFLPEEDYAGKGHVVILTASCWRNRFHSDPQIIGRSIVLDGVTQTIVGVLPQSFALPGLMNGFDARTQFFTPLNGPKWYEAGLIGEFDFTAIGRLRTDITREQALAELNVIQASIAKQAASDVDLRATLLPLQSEMVGPARRGLMMLLGAVGAVLLMICVNLANLLLSRVPGRLRDAAIRKALGATASQLFGQMLVECVLLAVLGGALGIVLAKTGVRWFAAAGPADIPRLSEVSLDLRAATFAFLLSLLTAVLFGALPAWLVSRADFQRTVNAAGRSFTESHATRKMRQALTTFEVATCTLLLIMAGLLGRSLFHLLHMDPGFSVEHVLAADIDLPPQSYGQRDAREVFYSRALYQLRSLPGVRSAAWVSILPLEGQGSVSGITLPANQLPPNQQPIANYRAVSPDYFQTMGIPIVAGRALNEADRGKRRVVVSQSLAKRLWTNESALGKEVEANWGQLRLSEVIGVAGDIHTRLDEPPLLMVYVSDSWAEPIAGAPSSASLVVRTSGDPASIASAVRNVIRGAGPDVPIVALRPMSQLVALNVEGRRFQMLLALCFGLSALLLAALGIFGVVAYSVEQRRREFGIRAALGAQAYALFAMVMRQGLSPVLSGLVVGLGGSFFLNKLLRSLIVGVSPSDPLTVTVAAILVLAAGASATYLPARNAMAADPVVALRCE